MTILSELETIASELDQSIPTSQTIDDLLHIKETYFGKNGRVSGIAKTIHTATDSEKPLIGRHINTLKSTYLKQVEDRIATIQTDAFNTQLRNETIDVTLPGRRCATGCRHPLSAAQARLVAICESLGFSVATGPIIEDMFHNFEALNIPPNHPARDMHDTFYVSKESVLRTHTSSVQIRHMQSGPPPYKIVAPGQVFRHDQDRTHSPMFHQLEGLYVDTDVSLPQLIHVLKTILHRFFDAEYPVRYRSSYFPFTEPSIEVDIQLPRSSDWLEVLGAGMVHPAVLRSVGVDPDVYTGFAFGLGIDRLAMIAGGVPDIRSYYDNNTQFLRREV